MKYLVRWNSNSRKDSHSTATDNLPWNGRGPGGANSHTPDYKFVGVVGRVISANRAVPIDTKPLYSRWSSSNKDNAMSSDPGWGPDHSVPGYTFVRNEGFVFSRPFAGTLELETWWSAGRKDQLTTSIPFDVGHVARTGSSNQYQRVRREGFIVPATLHQERELELANLLPRMGFGQLSKVAGGLPLGRRPLLVFLVEFADHRLTQTTSYFESLLFGPGHPNVAALFEDVSSRAFRWVNAGIVRVSFRETASTVLSEGFKNKFHQRLVDAAEASGVDFRQFARNGVVKAEDLGIIRISATYAVAVRAGGQTAPMSAQSRSGIKLVSRSANCDEQGDIRLYAHELFHQLGATQHIYGPGARVNWRMSFFAGHSSVDTGWNPVHLDPYNKMLAGWLAPRVVPIAAAGGCAVIDRPQGGYQNGKKPILFYDPERGVLDYFIVEFRSQTGAESGSFDYDSNVRGTGFFVWRIRQTNAGTLREIFDWLHPDSNAPTGHMYANYTYNPDNIRHGLADPLTLAHGEIALNWADGSDSRIRLRVDERRQAIQWRFDPHPFLPFIESAQRVQQSVSVVNLKGVFGLVSSGSEVFGRRGSANTWHQLRVVWRDEFVVQVEGPFNFQGTWEFRFRLDTSSDFSNTLRVSW